MIPVEIRTLISKCAPNPLRYKKICIAFNIKIDRRHIYRVLYKKLPVPSITQPKMLPSVRVIFNYTLNDKNWHRDSDKPTLVRVDGRMIWCENNDIHREGRPAVCYSSGDKDWFTYSILDKEKTSKWREIFINK